MTSQRAWMGAVLGLSVALCSSCGASTEEVPQDEGSLARQVQPWHSAGATRWVRRSVGSPGADVFPGDVTTDRDGANIVVGEYEGAPDFGNGPLPAAEESSTNVFIVKYARDGQLLWAHGFGAAGVPFSESDFEVAATDRQRNITVRGFTEASLTFGGVTVSGFFLVQFSRDGAVRWVRQLRGAYDGSPGLAVDREDNVILAGGVDGPADFGGGPRATGPISAFLVKYTRDGAWLWDRVFIAPDTSEFLGVDVDEENNLYAAGSFNSDTDFGGGTLHPSSPDTETAVVARYSPSGEHVWSRTLKGATALTRFDDVAVHGNRVVVAGRFRGQFKFDGHTFTTAGNTGLVLAMTRDGQDRWGHALGEWVFHVRADYEDKMTVLGVALPGDDVGSGPLPSTSSLYAFVSKFDRVEGTREWVRTFSAETATFVGLSVSREGEPAVTGSFHGPVDFGTGILVPTTPDIYDAFLLRMSP